MTRCIFCDREWLSEIAKTKYEYFDFLKLRGGDDEDDEDDEEVDDENL